MVEAQEVTYSFSPMAGICSGRPFYRAAFSVLMISRSAGITIPGLGSSTWSEYIAPMELNG